MSREWQQTRFKEFVMPDAVYYQSIWAVRDLRRMENRIREIDRDVSPSYDGSLVSDRCRDLRDPLRRRLWKKFCSKPESKRFKGHFIRSPRLTEIVC